MPGERFDYRIERQRHESFVGRADLLERLDQLLAGELAADAPADAADRWVLVTGGPGMGKSALLAWWLARRERAGAQVPHHFIRRGEYDWDDPGKLVGSLIAQLDEQFPAQREPDADAMLPAARHPAARLATAFARVSAGALVPHRRRLVVMIDGLDEYDPPPGTQPADPLAAFLPHALPAGVSFLCACRPRHPYVSGIEARSGALEQIDLDAPELAASNEATVRSYWEAVARSLGLPPYFVDEAVARAGGNLQHATMLRKFLSTLGTPMKRRVQSIPSGLEALLDKLWARVAASPLAVHGTGLLGAAREALTLDELGAAAGWTDEAERRAFMAGARELLVETWRPDCRREYRLHHETIREYIARAIGPAAIRAHHAALAERFAVWPAPEPSVRRYALRHGLAHRVEAGDWADAWRLAADMRFLEAKCRELGEPDTEADVSRAAERCRAAGAGEALCRRFDDLARALRRESHWLREAPEATAALVWNRLRRLGWSAAELAAELRLPAGASFLRVRHTTRRESPALVRELLRQSDEVVACAVTADGARAVAVLGDGAVRMWELATGHERSVPQALFAGDACAVTPEGRYVLAASGPSALAVWDLESSRKLATLRGSDRPPTACTVTRDGQRMILARAAHLEVWDLPAERLVATFEGHGAEVTACAVTADGRYAISASADRTLKIWELETRRSVATLEGHGAAVKACAVTADGRCVISASGDGTLKVWDLATGRELATLAGHAAAVNACAVTPDGRRLISASDDQTLKVWDLGTGRALATMTGHSSWVTDCAVTADGRVVSSSGDGTLKLWDLAQVYSEGATEPAIGVGAACAVSPGGRIAISARVDGALQIWDLESGQPLSLLEGHTAQVTACVALRDGRHALSASRDGTLKVWDLERRQAISTLSDEGMPVTACAVTADGRRVLSGSAGGALEVWDLASGQLSLRLAAHQDWVRACAISADGRYALSASDDGSARIWDLQQPAQALDLEPRAGGLLTCAAMLDERRAVAGTDSGEVVVFDLEAQRVISTVRVHEAAVTSVAVTAEGWCVIASDDCTLEVWDLERNHCLFTHHGDVPYCAVAASAQGLFACDLGGSIWVLDRAPGPSRAAQVEAPRTPSRESAAPVRRLLHLSDLHFARAEQATEAYAQLAADLREQGVERLDALVVSGDLVERADPAEYEAARRFLEPLMTNFGLAPRQVALVPGNHDASWPASEQAYRLHRRKQYMGPLDPGCFIERDDGYIIEVRDEVPYRERLAAFAALYRAIKGVDYPLAFEEQATVDELPDLGLCVLGLSSAWQCDHHFKDRAGIHPEALSRALSRLGPRPAGQLRLAAFHHPIHGGEDARIRDTGFLQQLAVHGFELALHGHVHKADSDLYRYDRSSGGRRIEIVAAGTFGAHTREWVPGYPLQYNLLLVEPSRITVETRCRREVHGAWEPDARWRQGPGRDPLPRYFIER